MICWLYNVSMFRISEAMRGGYSNTH